MMGILNLNEFQNQPRVLSSTSHPWQTEHSSNQNSIDLLLRRNNTKKKDSFNVSLFQNFVIHHWNAS